MKLSNLSGVSCSGASNRRVISVSRTILSLLFAMAATAVAQSSVTITNPAALLGWDAAIYASTYDATITTNQTRITTNGYNPPSTAIIDFQSGNQTVAYLTNIWSGVTNGTYSLFVKARGSTGIPAPNSTNLVFTVAFPPYPVGNLRVTQ